MQNAVVIREQGISISSSRRNDADKILESDSSTMTSDAAPEAEEADIIPQTGRQAVTRSRIVLPCLSVNLSTQDATQERDHPLPGEFLFCCGVLWACIMLSMSDGKN